MEAIVYRILYQSRKDLFKIFPLGDIHSGTIYCAEEKIKKQVKAIADDPFARWIGMGDYADLIIKGDKRFEHHLIPDWVKPDNIPQCQFRWLRDLLMPIRDKCIGLIEGNHEAGFRKEHSFDMIANLCDSEDGLGVTYLGYSCLVKFIFVRQLHDVHTFKAHFTHGSGCPATEGGKMMNLKKSLDDFEGDIYATGHIHDIKITEKPMLGMTGSDPPVIVNKNRCGAVTGSWFQTYMQGSKPSYGEMKRYSPTPIGCPVFVIDPTRELVNVYSNTNMMIKRLEGND